MKDRLSLKKDRFFIGGTFKNDPSDFIVEELWDNHICTINHSWLERARDYVSTRIQGPKEYLHFTLIKHNWDTIRALRYLGKKIHVSIKRFGIAGMKDKRAITSQRVSLWKGRAEQLTRLRLRDIQLKNFHYSDERINLGAAQGNRFTITLHDIDKPKDEIQEVLRRFKHEVMTRGVPNAYGPQRFGGRNSEVGEALKEGNLRQGVELILEKVQPYIEHGDIEQIPKALWYEKKMLRHLHKYPNDYAGALRCIPKKIRRIYTHAYQSRLFNDKLHRAIKSNAVPEEITVPGFRVSKMPEVSTIPISRRSYLITQNFQILEIEDSTVILQFTLHSGEYASTLLSNLTNVYTP